MQNNFTPVDHLIKKTSQQVSYGKEMEPPRAAVSEMQMDEVVEHTPDKDVLEHVEVRPEKIILSADLKKMGLQEVSHTKYPTTQSIPLPLGDEKIYNGLHAPLTSSLRWLSEFALYLLRQSHLTLKQVHGKVVRIVQRG